MGDDQRTLWCGNLADKVTEAILYELFLQAGPLQRVTIPTDRDGRQRSYAFITFKHECSVLYALSLFEDTKLFNRVLSLSAKSGRAAEGLDRGPSGRRAEAPVPLVAPWARDAPPKDVPLDFNALLQLGQQMMLPAMSFNMPFQQMPGLASLPVYASQMGGQSYLGGAVGPKGHHGYQHARSHPYSAPAHDGYRNNGKNYRHGVRH
ncbi:RNA-binding protein 7 [Bacillus rossius redtenbacheri]|uniref:RNA-binding protein 7 n=1 Tax=Bacillus rossius redtenbacheri TaxID=93214 RepID=UPI002FDEF622